MTPFIILLKCKVTKIFIIYMEISGRFFEMGSHMLLYWTIKYVSN